MNSSVVLVAGGCVQKDCNRLVIQKSTDEPGSCWEGAGLSLETPRLAMVQESMLRK